MKDAPFAQGRLVVKPTGLGTFLFLVYVGTKANPELRHAWWGGRKATDEEAGRLAQLH